MKKILSMALTAMMAVSCAEAQDVAFTVEGTAPQGVDTLYVFYNGQMNEAQPIAAKEGKFEVKGNQPAETFITVAASNQLMVAAMSVTYLKSGRSANNFAMSASLMTSFLAVFTKHAPFGIFESNA